MRLVTRSTASGDRFPVGVNWMEVSKVIGHAPVECVKRYAFLHQHQNAVSTQDEEDEEEKDDIEEAQSPIRGSFLDYCSPVVSPKIAGGSLGAFEEFGVGSPGSPPPFAVRQLHKASSNTTNASSPFRWEAMRHDSPILKPPPHVLRRQAMESATSFGISSDNDDIQSQESVQSPRIIHGTQEHSRHAHDPDFAANIVNHAFKGMQLSSPVRNSPRLIRTCSNDYPFAQDEEAHGRQIARQQVDPSTTESTTAQRNPTMQMSSFHGDNPFTGSLTQSALEEAFLDMAGSRLDASSMFFSRASLATSHLQPTKNRPPGFRENQREGASGAPCSRLLVIPSI